jgi:hypothetical protein
MKLTAILLTTTIFVASAHAAEATTPPLSQWWNQPTCEPAGMPARTFVKERGSTAWLEDWKDGQGYVVDEGLHVVQHWFPTEAACRAWSKADQAALEAAAASLEPIHLPPSRRPRWWQIGYHCHPAAMPPSAYLGEPDHGRIEDDGTRVMVTTKNDGTLVFFRSQEACEHWLDQYE